MPTPPVKLYYRIGEVADIVGVEPHVLRYWETEFRTIRPQKSARGQRVYSRRDVEKLLNVKDLLYNHGFTIAGARKRLREGIAAPAPAEQAAAPAPEPAPAAVAAGVAPAAGLQPEALRSKLTELRSDVQAMLDGLERPSEPSREA
ncbi:MAG: MerR family transcriptional regulator [Polyangiaceae bacterium]|nr:MerR family transcriptional regulator [Polyangiaceae bacterium]